jgi:hypothetical protein
MRGGGRAQRSAPEGARVKIIAFHGGARDKADFGIGEAEGAVDVYHAGGGRRGVGQVYFGKALLDYGGF